MARLSLLIALGVAATLPLQAAVQPISVRGSFRIGGGGSVLCLAQGMASDPSLTSMFDRGYSIVCRDAAIPIGLVHVLKMGRDDPRARLASLRADRVDCGEPASGTLEGVGAISIRDCKLKSDARVPYRVYQIERHRLLYSAEGLTGYDSALRIALRSVISDRPVAGEVDVATTGAGDPAAFARVQAGTLDRSRALAEAYRRNNAGSYAESAEFFAAVTRGEMGRSAQAEALVNEGLQKSNLGDYYEADQLFDRAESLLGNDPLVARQLRNYRAMHFLNEGLAKDSLAELSKPLPDAARLPAPAIKRLAIDASTAARLNADAAASDGLGAGTTGLQIDEKVQILDAQMDQLRGPALRLTGDLAGATAALLKADGELAAIRGGRLASIVWMRAQILSELGAVEEQRGDAALAEQYYRKSVDALAVDYPGSAALQSARGRLAAYLARSGQTAAATAMFRDIVRANLGGGDNPPSLARLLSPYAELLLKAGTDRQSVADLFEAAQVMIRPGVAQTQAVLARELSGGSDEASRLFRQAVTLTRQIERSRSELSRLELGGVLAASQAAKKQTLMTSIDEYQKDQVATQASLAAFPRFRAVTPGELSLDELQKLLRPGEAYYKLTVIDDLVFALFVTPQSTRAFRIDATASQLDQQVDKLRQTIAKASGGQTVTYPFDVALARKLYLSLFGPIDSDLGALHHLIVEPDGAMLRLTPNLLVRDQASVASYAGRVAAGGDEFDFTGIDWLGRNLDISTSVSARSFRDVRQAPRSSGRYEYLGLGDNARPSAALAARREAFAPDGLDCSMPLAAWSNPVSAKELQLARNILKPANPASAEVMIGDAFTDTGLKARADLDQYRIIHFATHGIVTPPKPGCPSQPALVTSFGGSGSDGLLTFREIFDLRLNADLVILSACDTAGTASAAATQEAGLGSGGGLALDGLVRAFVGAGGRLLVASHWPVPDDYDATQRLIGGIFSAAPGTPTVTALRLSERKLMDVPATSHPYYWAAFAVIGDGTSPVIDKAPARLATSH